MKGHFLNKSISLLSLNRYAARPTRLNSTLMIISMRSRIMSNAHSIACTLRNYCVCPAEWGIDQATLNFMLEVDTEALAVEAMESSTDSDRLLANMPMSQPSPTLGKHSRLPSAWSTLR